MPVSRAKKTFTITNIPGCEAHEVVIARKRFTVGDQEAINNQLMAMSLENNDIDMKTNFGAIKRATICQMVEAWTLQEEIEVGGEIRIVPLPQPNEDPDVISDLDITIADYLFNAIQLKQNPADALKTVKAQEDFLDSANEPSSESEAKTKPSH